MMEGTVGDQGGRVVRYDGGGTVQGLTGTYPGLSSRLQTLLKVQLVLLGGSHWSVGTNNYNSIFQLDIHCYIL